MQYIVGIIIITSIIISIILVTIKNKEKFWMNPSRTIKVERIIRYPDGREYSLRPDYGKMLAELNKDII